LKQRLDFPLEKKIETTDRLPTRKCQKIVETTVRFSIAQRIKTMDRLFTMHGQKIVETTVRFFL